MTQLGAVNDGRAGVEPLPFGPTSVGEVLDRGLARHPTQDALVDARHRLDYAAADALVRLLVAGFGRLGLEPGDRVAVSLPNSVHAVATFLACMRAGLQFVGVHPGLAEVEQRRLLDLAPPDLLIATGDAVGSLRGAPGAAIALDLDDPSMGEIARPGEHRTTVEIDPHAPAAIAFTSGTTGEPKGVVHDQHHMLLPASVILHHRMQDRGERIGVHLPLTTLNVLILGPVLALLGGGTCVCIDGHAAPQLATTIERERIDHLATSPAVVLDLLAHPDVDARRQLAGLRLGVGGVACPEQLRIDYEREVGRVFTTGYGLTEAPAALTQETERIPHRPGASGVAMAHVEIEVVDEEGRPLTTGAVGEITAVAATTGPWARCFRGLHSYHDGPDATRAVLAGGRLHTGDIGSLDADGYLSVADRRSDMINRGGSKVSPAEVERVLLDHPAVADCIVLGRPSARLGETVAAMVQVAAGDEVTSAELRAHCAAVLSSYKVPTDLVVVDDLPRNPMGKVVRELARAWFEAPRAPEAP